MESQPSSSSTTSAADDIHSTPSKPSPDGARKSGRSVTRTQLYQSPVKSTMRSPSKRPHPESIPSSPDYLHEEQSEPVTATVQPDSNTLLLSALIEDQFKSTLCVAAGLTANHEIQLFLPILTVIAGLMGISTIKTHRDIEMEEPNILWTVVASPPGSKKSVAMKYLLKALKAVQDTISTETETSLSGDVLASSAPGALYSANETITTPKLAAQLCANDGIYLNLIDEIEGLFETLDGKSRDNLDRRLWLSLNTGAPVTRATSNKIMTVDETRLNYTGYIQPGLLERRFEKQDYDGFLDRHLVVSTCRKTVLFGDIEKKADKGTKLTALFQEVYRRHHNEDHRSLQSTYRLSEEAGALFEKFFNSMEETYEQQERKGKTGVLGLIGKASGQLLRIAMVFQAAHNAANDSDGFQVTAEVMKEATAVIKLLTSEKLKLLGETLEQNNATADVSEFGTDEEVMALPVLRKLLSFEIQLTTAQMMQKDLVPEVAKGDAETTKRWMRKVAALGFGECLSGKQIRSLKFRRYAIHKMSKDCQQVARQVPTKSKSKKSQKSE